MVLHVSPLAVKTSPQGLFNFKPSVRPVPLECHIQGYPGRFYCPRMATMNKPAYAAIQTHSPRKPVLVFVSSRRWVLSACMQPVYVQQLTSSNLFVYQQLTSSNRHHLGGVP